MAARLAAACLCTAATLPRAETWTLRASVATEATATDNGGRAPPGSERKDLVWALRPTLQVNADGVGLKLRSTFGVDVVAHAASGVDDQVLPRANASLSATLIERLMFVDMSADVHRAEVDPYGVAASPTSVRNGQTASTLRISPRLGRQFGKGMSWSLRHESTFTHSSDAKLADQRVAKTEIGVEAKPAPVGGEVQVSRHEVRSSGSAESRWRFDTARVVADVAVGHDLLVGAIGGYEHGVYSLTSTHDSRVGARLRWTPTERSDLKAEAERRFFGFGWDVEARHRSPFMSMSLRWTRTPLLTASSMGTVGAGSNLADFLDAILTTRNPDPAARAAIVSGLVNGRGLDVRLPNPIDVVAEYAQLQTGLNASVTVLGSRNATTVSLYRQSLRQLVRDGSPLASGSAASDNVQTGLTLGFNRKLTPQLAANVNASWSRISGLATREGDSTRHRSLRVSLVDTVSSRTTLSAGVQFDRMGTTVANVQGYASAALVAGLQHRF